MELTGKAAHALGNAIKNVHAGADKLFAKKLAPKLAPTLMVQSPAFTGLGRLPVSATAEGQGTPPPISWSAPPAGTKSLVVMVEDPEAPLPEPFVHWMVYDIGAGVRSLDRESVPGCTMGENSKLQSTFTPAAPPPGHGEHGYHFQVFALDIGTDFVPALGRKALLERLLGHVLAWGELVGTYSRA
jgi:Raf kinase inhibitor-like YbhB/YbcL family protein